MANKTITEFGTISGMASGDEVLVWDASTSLTRKVTYTNFGAAYALLAGRSGGQVLYGGTGSGDDITIDSTSHATKGSVLLGTGGGLIGVGTTSPSRLLHLSASAGGFIRLSNTDATTDAEVNGLVEWYRGDNTNRTAWVGHPSTGNEDFAITNITSGGNLDLYTANSLAVRVDSSGNVGIGTSTINSVLEVNGSIRGSYDANTTSYFGRAAVGYNGTDGDQASFAHIDQNSSAGYALIQTSGGITTVNSASGQAIRFAIAGTTIYNADTVAFYPEADNSRDLGKSGNRYDDVYATNGTIQTSDGGEKRDITDSDLGLDFVKHLRPVRYKWHSTEEKPTRRPHYGLIAQEVKATLDEMEVDFAGYIHDPEADAYGLRYSEFIGPLVKAVQELAAENESLSNQIALLRGP